MRSLNTFQNDQANLLLMNLTQDRRIPSLTSQFMDMFDASKLDTSLLRKRELPFQDNLINDQLQKKVKTSLLTNDFTRQIPSFSPALFNRNTTLNPLTNSLFNSLSQDQYGSLLDQFKAVQNLSFSNILNQQAAFQPLNFPSQIGLNNVKPNTLLEKALTRKDICVKEEYVKPEEHPVNQGSPNAGLFKSTLSEGQTTNDLLTENSPAQTDFQAFSEPTGEPALTEFTKAFPDWDLATIFNYLKSGKSMEVFEKEKQFRLERKLRRQQRRNKEKANGESAKKTKGRKAASDEYKPARGGKKL